MAQTLITGTELTREFLDVLHSNLVIAKSMDRTYESRFSNSGYDGQKIGPTLQIRKPNQFKVRSTWPMSTQDLTEPYASLTIDTVRGIDLNFPDADLALRIDDFKERYITTAAKRLASEIDKVCGAYIKNHTPNIAGTAGTQPNAASIFLDAARRVKEHLVPMDGEMRAIISPYTEATMVAALAGQYNPQGNISAMFEDGQMSNALGMKWFMSQVLTSHACGTRTTSTPVVAASQNGASISVTGAGNAVTYLEGDIVTFAGVYDINPETKQKLGILKQFRITATCTASAGGAVTLLISPSIDCVSTSAEQNCYSASDPYIPTSAAVVPVGTASYTYYNDIVMHRKAFALATIDLLVPGGMDMAAKASADGISVRFVRGYDIFNARMLSRMDVFFGVTELRPEWSCRVIGYGA